MSQKKKEVRRRFRETVFSRDGHRCRACGADSDWLDAHHITPRKEMPSGGYVPENGISLCPTCHVVAEYHLTGLVPEHVPDPAYSPEKLYKLIGSSYEQALKASDGS